VIDFDQICVAVAVILAALSLRQFRMINMLLALNFTLFELSSHFILSFLAGRPSMILHAIYVLIGGLTVISLVKLKSAPPLFITTFLFSVYNLAIVSEFVFLGSLGFHDNFEIVARTQMIIELLIMCLTGVGGLYVFRGLLPKSNYIHRINELFRSSVRMGGKRLA